MFLIRGPISSPSSPAALVSMVIVACGSSLSRFGAAGAWRGPGPGGSKTRPGWACEGDGEALRQTPGAGERTSERATRIEAYMSAGGPKGRSGRPKVTSPGPL